MTSTSPPGQPEPKWYKSNALIVGVVLAVLAAVLGLGSALLTKDRPDSDEATIVLDTVPRGGPGRTQFMIRGGGWNADNAVKITFPLRAFGRTEATKDFLVQGGSFTASIESGNLEYKVLYTVTVEGKQSGHRQAVALSVI